MREHSRAKVSRESRGRIYIYAYVIIGALLLMYMYVFQQFVGVRLHYGQP